MTVPVGTLLICIQSHPDGLFTQGQIYKVNALGKRGGVRIRDDKRERKDFNYIPTSKNYIWAYFKLSSP
ncbi:hypothetical protein D3C76_967880 [compost metagenome]